MCKFLNNYAEEPMDEPGSFENEATNYRVKVHKKEEFVYGENNRKNHRYQKRTKFKVERSI